MLVIRKAVHIWRQINMIENLHKGLFSWEPKAAIKKKNKQAGEMTQ